ncbi:hypothetical protein AWF78_11650 [Escherichia coli]|nr:hypothetical protein AWF78_11650 [Escherichia coli]
MLQRLPHVAQRAARDHVRTVKKNLHDIELEGHHLIRSAVPLEMSWILETNTGMNNMLERIGAEPYKRYRLYEKQI